MPMQSQPDLQTQADPQRLLAEAANRTSAVDLESRQGETVVRQQSRLLGLVADEPAHVLVEMPKLNAAPNTTDNGLRVGQQIVVSIGIGRSCHRFVSSILAVGTPASADGQQVQALELAWPEAVEQTERRKSFRARIPSNQPVDVAVRVGGSLRRERSVIRISAYRGRLVDISVGGAMVLLSGQPEPGREVAATMPVELRLTLEPNGPPLRLEAVIRRRADKPGGVTELGVEFSGLDRSDEGRKTRKYLAQAITRLERKNIHLRRLDID